MAKTDIGPKIGIEGEAQFRRELSQINQGLKTLDAEAKAVAASMQDETDAEKKAAAQKDVLNRQILSQKEKLDKLQQGLEASAKKYGEADTRTQKWQKAVYDATRDLANMEHELKDLDGSVDEATGSMEEAGAAATSWAEVMKGQLCADLVKKGVKELAVLIKNQATALWDASKAGAAYADTYNTMAAESGLSTDTLQEYAYMADLVDVSVETLVGAQSKLINTMRGARDGTGAAAETWKALGIQIENADGKLRSAEDVMQETLEALGKLENDTERDAAAMAIFGKSAQELNPLIKTGADRIAELRKEAHDTGYVLSGSALTALNRQQDAMDKLGKRVEAVGNNFAAKLAPGVERGANALNEAFDNPRVQRGINVLSEGIGNATSSVMEFAANALPKLFSVFTMGDEKLKYFTDDQLALANSLDEIVAGHQEMISTYKENAKEIVEETERTEELWKELQRLVGENGEVKKADEERVNYINSQLKEALGVQMELEDGILQGYKEQQKEIDKLIKKREAEALLAAGAEDFAKAEKAREEALANAAKTAPEYEKSLRALERAERNLGKAVADAEKNRDNAGAGVRRAAIEKAQKELEEARNAYAAMEKQYEEARERAQKYYKDVDVWQRAQTAAANENYDEVVRILTSEFEVTLDYYREKKALNEKEKADLKAKIKDAELNIAEYKKNLKAGLQGFSEAGLKEMEDYVAEARRILDGKSVGTHFIDGMISGLKDRQKLRELREASEAAAGTVRDGATRVLQIQSPSRVGHYIGTMWPAGIAGGIKDGTKELERTAEQMSKTLASASVPSPAMLRTGTYSSGVMAAPIGAYGGGGTSSYTTNMGGITVRIDGAGAVNADELAQRVAVRLTDQLNRAARGGRRR